MRQKKKKSYGVMFTVIIALLVCEFAVIITGLWIMQTKNVSANEVYSTSTVENDESKSVAEHTKAVMPLLEDNLAIITVSTEGNAEPTVEDTKIAPFATIINYKAWSNGDLGADYIEPILFVTDIGGGSGDVVAIYKDEPDLTHIGVQEITIQLIDVHDPENITELTAQLEIEKSTNPPQIEGTRDMTLYLGDRAFLDKDIVIDSDKNLHLAIDTSYADFDTPGTYVIIYRAKDDETCVASDIVNINIKPRPVAYEGLSDAELARLDELNAMADTILEKIIKENMTQEEILKAIYQWGKSNVAYVGTSDKTSWVNEAITGIKRRRGDCFTYFAIAKALLTRMEIENIDVIKSDTRRSSHFWSMVNVGDGWYHFDGTPRSDKSEFFMLTDEEILSYSVRNRDTHIFDRTLYPYTPYRGEGQT